jgi:hypothetical protein
MRQKETHEMHATHYLCCKQCVPNCNSRYGPDTNINALSWNMTFKIQAWHWPLSSIPGSCAWHIVLLCNIFVPSNFKIQSWGTKNRPDTNINALSWQMTYKIKVWPWPLRCRLGVDCDALFYWATHFCKVILKFIHGRQRYGLYTNVGQKDGQT